MTDPGAGEELARLPLAEERLRVRRRRRVTGRVRVTVSTAVEQRALDDVLRHRRVDVERVQVGREVEAPPPIRQEGATVIIPVLEERFVLVRRLVLAEELRLHLREEEEAVSVPVGIRREQVAVERFALPPDNDQQHDSSPAEDSRMNRTLIALFDSRAEADRAADALRGLNVQASGVRVQHASGEQGWLPEDDRATWQEGLRRGGALVVAEVEERGFELAANAMEAAGAVDIETREAEWRSQGWTGGSAAGLAAGAPDGAPGNPPGTMASRAVDQVAGTNISGAHPENEATRGRATASGTTGAGHGTAAGGTGGATRTAAAGATGREETIPIAEEQLRVGKRVTHAGQVRVRSYVVETPVEEQVRLREEHVRVERRPADRAATGSDADLFRDRVIEAEESTEEAVVQKDVRVTGEVVVNKEATERTETVRDKVRRTEVEVDKNAANDPKRRGGKGAA
ncbi:DUF2382 domain-containing protein [Falsiroseomonas sp. HW251]|uniref:DUF2382 domain-containing protein n=1 Tax=Falsiroseomonas sp. HW251 TaxID=3390998 RepID=UPI003D3203C5